MKRIVIIVSAVLALVSFVPTTANASVLKEYAAGIMDFQDSEVTISYSQGSVYVSGGEGLTIEVVSLTGNKVFEEVITSPSQKFDLNIPKGCYIVKVGKVVRKVSIH
ncbi:MAG: T9SS C-terminal target domain-containing protein [Prevotella sp.]|nr:T9SS C-terminal target domain-containing protein [Prevotella sp.]